MQKIKFQKEEKLDFKTSEAFKTLRTNITFCGDDIKAILLTSSMPDEGKTSLAFQLAKSFAETEKKTLLLDADIRKSVLMGRYGVTEKVNGLSHYLSGQQDLPNVVYETNIEYLDVIFAGPSSPNPAELLASDRFDRLMKEKKQEYDYIIIDAPPLGSVIDAAIIGAKSDGAILVVESYSISYKIAQDVTEQLKKSGCRMLGVVLNKVTSDDKSYYRGYYSKYYKRYGYGYGKSKEYGYGYGQKEVEKSK